MQLPDKASADVVANWFRLEKVRRELALAERYDEAQRAFEPVRLASQDLADLPSAGLPNVVVEFRTAWGCAGSEDCVSFLRLPEAAEQLYRQLARTGVTVASVELPVEARSEDRHATT